MSHAINKTSVTYGNIPSLYLCELFMKLCLLLFSLRRNKDLDSIYNTE